MRTPLAVAAALSGVLALAGCGADPAPIGPVQRYGEPVAAAPAQARLQVGATELWSTESLGMTDGASVRFAGRYAVTAGNGSTFSRVQVVDAATGATLRTMDAQLTTCKLDGGLVACTSLLRNPDRQIVTWQPGERQPRVTGTPPPDQFSDALGGYLFSGYGFADGQYAVDRSGNVLSAKLPGDIVHLDGTYAVFRTGSTSLSLHVHEVSP